MFLFQGSNKEIKFSFQLLDGYKMMNSTEYAWSRNSSEVVLATGLPSGSTENLNDTDCGQEINDTVSEFLWKILPPFLFCFGLIGNILTIIVIRRLRFRNQPTLPFLLYLAVNDSVVLCTGLPRYWIKYVFEFDLRTASNANCKLYYFFIYMTMQNSSWILVGVTLERLVKLYFPFKYRRIYSGKKVVIGLSVTLVVLVLVNGHFFFTNGINEYTKYDCSSLNDDFSYFDNYVFVYIDFTILSAVPFIIMLICNILLVKGLRKVQLQRVSMMHRSVYKRTSRISVKMTKMLIVCTFYFLFATAPISIYFILDTYLSPGFKDSGNCSAQAKMDLAGSITYLIQYSNYCINFYLYTAANSKFYKELKGVLCCKRSLRILGAYRTQRIGSSGRTLAPSVQTNSISQESPVSEENRF